MDGISFFSGIGGLDLGFERAGIRILAQIEKDPFCLKVLAKHWPNVPRYGDIRDVGKKNLPRADVFFGGFPCQPHSTAGKRKGASDDRDLWPEYRRVINECRPAWVVGENVLGIRTTILDQVLSDLESLGYSAVALDLPAAGFNAPHIRERIFIVAHSKSSTGRLSEQSRKEILHTGGIGTDGDVADAKSKGLEGRTRTGVQRSIPSQRTRENACNSDRQGLAVGQSQRENDEQEQPSFIRANWWNAEPGVCGVANGVSNRVDRIRALGNAVVPQVAEFLGRALVTAENLTS